MDDELRQRSVRYPVAFQASGAAPAAGALVVSDQEILLTGRPIGAATEPVEVSIACTDLARVRIGRATDERLNGHATVVLERNTNDPVLVAPFGGGLLHEITDLLARLASRHDEAADRITLLVPIKRNHRERVRHLVAQGPPFDPTTHGLRRHDVFLSQHAVVFVFEGPDVQATLRRTLTEPHLWRAGIAWRNCIAGQPRVAEHDEKEIASGDLIYSWRS